MINTLFRSRANQQKLASIGARQLHEKMQLDSELVIIDVRSAEEFTRGHISGTRLLPLATIHLRHDEIPHNLPVVVTCRSGARSRAAIEQLRKLGFTNLINLDGGLLSWQRAGLPLTT